jgi:hypothetical protein
MTPFLVHLIFIVPGADDYCYAAGALEHGFFNNIWRFYVEWSGRLAGTALLSLPLFVQSKASLPFVYSYQAVSAFMVILFLISIYFFFWINRLFTKPRQGLFLCALVLAGTVATSARTRDLFFWHSASFTYTLAGILYICLIAQLHRRSFSEGPAQRFNPVLWVLCLFAATLNEFTGISLALISLACLFLVTFYQKSERRRKIDISLFAAFSLAGFSLVSLAPGNENRLATWSERSDIPTAIAKGLFDYYNYFNEQYFTSGLIIFCILVFIFFLNLDIDKNIRHKKFPNIGLFHLFAWVVLSGLAFLAARYGTGTELPQRAQNQLQIVGLTAVAVLIGCSVTAHRTQIMECLKSRTSHILNFGTPVSWALLVALFLNVPYLQATFHLVTDRSGNVFEQQVNRIDLIVSGDDDVQVPPITESSGLISPSEIGYPGDDSYWINECMARYFGKRSITLTE